jgi:hypothetical protein
MDPRGLAGSHRRGGQEGAVLRVPGVHGSEIRHEDQDYVNEMIVSVGRVTAGLSKVMIGMAQLAAASRRAGAIFRRLPEQEATSARLAAWHPGCDAMHWSAPDDAQAVPPWRV